MSANTLTITDNRTGKQYELPSSGHVTSGKKRVCLPNMRDLVRRAHHWITRLAMERLGKLGHVRQRAVRPPFRRRMRICLHSRSKLFGARVCAPRLGVSDEESLLGRVAVNHFPLPCSIQRTLERVVRRNHAAEVREILPQRQLAVHVDRVNLHVSVELIDDQLGLLAEAHGIAWDPPVGEIAFCVVTSPLVVEAVSQLVAGPAAAE